MIVPATRVILSDTRSLSYERGVLNILLSNSSEKCVPIFFQGIKHISDCFGRDTICFSSPVKYLS